MPPFTFPRDLLRLLYWIYFKPLSLRRYARQLHPQLDDDLKVWELPPAERRQPAIQSLTQLVVTLLLGAPLTLTTLIGLLYSVGYEIFDWWRALAPIAAESGWWAALGVFAVEFDLWTQLGWIIADFNWRDGLEVAGGYTLGTSFILWYRMRKGLGVTRFERWFLTGFYVLLGVLILIGILSIVAPSLLRGGGRLRIFCEVIHRWHKRSSRC